MTWPGTLAGRVKMPGSGSWHRRPANGFTLIELTIAVSILGMVMAALAAAMIVVLRTNTQTLDRLDRANTLDLATVYFTPDVNGASSAITLGSAATAAAIGSATATCELAASTLAVEFDGTVMQPDGSWQTQTTSYVLVPVPAVPPATQSTQNLVRLTCQADSPTPTSDKVIAEKLVIGTAGGEQPVAVLCRDGSGADITPTADADPLECPAQTVSVDLTVRSATGVTSTLTANTRASRVPTGGSLEILDGQPGRTAYNDTDTLVIGGTDFAWAVDEPAAQTLTEASATLTDGACGVFSAATKIADNLSAPITRTGLKTKCYRYVLSALDSLGQPLVQVSQIVANDLAYPAGGKLTVNGTLASTSGSRSYNRTGAFPIDRTDFTDANAGLDETGSLLTREQAALANGSCGPFGSPTIVTGAAEQTGLAGGCYRFTLSATDRAGNAAMPLRSTVMVDPTPPSGGALTVNGTAGDADGTTSNSTSGTYQINTRTDFTDSGSGLASSTLTRAFAPMSGGACGAFGAELGIAGSPTQSGMANGCYRYTLTGADLAGGTSALSTTVRVSVVAPTSGSLVVNNVAATVGGSTSHTRYSPVAINSRSDFTGVTSSVLTSKRAVLANGLCGAFATATTISGTTAQPVVSGYCYQFTLTGTPSSGPVLTLTTTVLVDSATPTMQLSVANADGAALSGSVIYLDTAQAGSFDLLAAVTDGLAGPAAARFPEVTASGWTHPDQTVSAGTGAAPTFTFPSTFAWAAGASIPAGGYTVTGTDQAGGSVTATVTFAADSTPPTGGALTVNGVAATTSGSASTVFGPSFTIGTRTVFTDPGSGITAEGSALLRQFAPLTATTCGSFDAGEPIVGTPTQTALPTGCYRFTLSATDNVGNTASIRTTVQVRPYVTGLSISNVTGGTAGKPEKGDTIRVTYSDKLSASSMCSAWSGDDTLKTMAGDKQVRVRITNSASNDVLTVTSTLCTFNFGSIALGGNYVGSSRSFYGSGTDRATITWDPTAKTLTIVLGRASGSTRTVSGSTTSIFSVSTAVKSIAAIPTGGTFSSTGVKF